MPSKARFRRGSGEYLPAKDKDIQTSCITLRDRLYRITLSNMVTQNLIEMNVSIDDLRVLASVLPRYLKEAQEAQIKAQFDEEMEEYQRRLASPEVYIHPMPPKSLHERLGLPAPQAQSGRQNDPPIEDALLDLSSYGT